jgi:hypothetical protein
MRNFLVRYAGMCCLARQWRPRGWGLIGAMAPEVDARQCIRRLARPFIVSGQRQEATDRYLTAGNVGRGLTLVPEGKNIFTERR